MKNINENNLSNPFQPKSDRMVLSNRINRRLNRNNKLPSRLLSLKKNSFLNLKLQNQNKINFPKLSGIYPSSSNNNLKLNYPKIKSAQIVDKKNLSFGKEIPYNHIKELSSNIFQSNDIDLVRNLDPDSNKDLINNLLFKGNLKNKLESRINFSNYNKKEHVEKNEESTEKVEKNEEDGDLNKVLENKFLKIKQNNLYEKELNKKLKELKENYIFLKQDKIKINNKFKQMLKEIDNIGYDIHLLEKEPTVRNPKLLDTSIRANDKSQSFHISSKNKMENKLTLKDENLKKRMSVFQNYFNLQKKRSNEKKKKVKRILELKKDLNELKMPLNSINQKIIEIRDIEKSTKEKLMKHYLELLYDGKEVRGEGLIWIIKGIWKIGENVPMSFMPTFLDFDAIKYLFKMAKISIELESTKKYIMDIKLNLKQKVNNMPINQLLLANEKNIEDNSGKNDNDNENYKENEINNLNINFMNKLDNINNSSEIKHSKNRKSSLLYKKNYIFKKKLMNSASTPNLTKEIMNFNNYRNFNMSEDEKNKEIKSTVLSLSKIFEKKEKNHFDIENMKEVKEINKLKKKIMLLNNQIEELKNNEVQRIFHEYVYNDYERVYHAPIEVVLGALIGGHSKDIQLNNYSVFRKGYLDEIRNIRFYEYGKRK